MLQTAFQILRQSTSRAVGAFKRHAETNEPGWGTTIDQVIADLESLNHTTERDFLAVGGKLMEFLSVARQISCDMAALTELISGEHGRNASQALSRMMEHSQAMGVGIEESQQSLASVRDLSRRIQFAFLKIREMVATIQTLCTLTRIETSRLGTGGTGFGDLADEVNPLSHSIQSSGHGVLEASARLNQSIQTSLRSGSELSALQLKELQSLIARVAESLQAFEERRERAIEASSQHAVQHASMCAAIEDLVGSIQFHDITRQQIEHVCQALRAVRREAADRPMARGLFAPESQMALSLQSSQLSNAGLAFARSMEHMQRDLESIAVRAGEMAEASRTLMGFSGDEKDSFFLRMEGLFTAIIHTVGACVGADSALRSTASAMEGTIAGMRESVEQIRSVEIQIQRIAINATIRSAHIGAAGNGLNVIADVLRRVALDSNTNTEAAAGALDSMRAATRRVSGGSSSAISNGQPDTEDPMAQMRAAILELHSSSESSFSRVSQISTLGSRLSAEVRSLRDALTAGPLFAEVVANACAELERLSARAGPTSSETEQFAGENLQRFATVYTMQAEHDVHQSVINGVANPAPDSPDRLAVGSGDGALGDNVELF